jgi:hypothetical protein
VFIYCRYKSVVTKLIAYSSEYKIVFQYVHLFVVCLVSPDIACVDLSGLCQSAKSIPDVADLLGRILLPPSDRIILRMMVLNAWDIQLKMDSKPKGGRGRPVFYMCLKFYIR